MSQIDAGGSQSSAAGPPSTLRSGPGAWGALALIPLAPLAWLASKLIFRVGEKSGVQIVTFTSFSSLAYTWPIVAAGFICWLLGGLVSAEVLGWAYMLTIFGVLLVLGTDLNRNAALTWALSITLVFTGGALVNAYWQIPVLGQLYSGLAALGVKFDPGMGLGLSYFLLVMLIVTVAGAMLDGSHEISSREVTHRRFLRTSESWPLGVNRVRMEWPDLMEMFVLFGAGHLVVLDQDRKEVLRIPNIPFLWFVRKEVNEVLDIMATTHVDSRSMAAS